MLYEVSFMWLNTRYFIGLLLSWCKDGLVLHVAIFKQKWMIFQVIISKNVKQKGRGWLSYWEEPLRQKICASIYSWSCTELAVRQCVLSGWKHNTRLLIIPAFNEVAQAAMLCCIQINTAAFQQLNSISFPDLRRAWETQHFPPKKLFFNCCWQPHLLPSKDKLMASKQITVMLRWAGELLLSPFTKTSSQITRGILHLTENKRISRPSLKEGCWITNLSLQISTVVGKQLWSGTLQRPFIACKLPLLHLSRCSHELWAISTLDITSLNSTEKNDDLWRLKHHYTATE